MLKLSVIIVNYKTPELLRLCLKRLEEHLKGIDYEVVVIDNAATPPNPLLSIRGGEGGVVRYIPIKQNIGFARGVNKGLLETSGQYKLILNPDALITEGSVQKMLAYMDRHQDIGMMGPQLLYFNGNHQRSYHRFYRPITIFARRTFLGKILKNVMDDFMMADTDPTKIQTPDWILGAAMLVRAEAVKKVGLMDERYFLYFEDVDWCRRFWHNDYKVVYYPSAVFYH